VTISADVWSRVSIDTARANVSYPDGSWTWLDLTYSGSGDTYTGVFENIWNWGDYGYWIWANNTAGFANDTNMTPGKFYLKVNSTVSVKTAEDLYGSNQLVYLEQKDEWWDANWSHRVPMNITEMSGDALTEYQIKVDINTTQLYDAGVLRDDCGDARFIWHNTTSDGWSEMSHWNETACNTTGGNSTFWFQLPDIGAGEEITVYLYTGNPDATGTANKSEVFSYGSPQTLYYVVHDGAAGNNLNVSAYYNNTNVTVGSASYMLNEGDVATFGSIVQGSAVITDKPVAGIIIGDAMDTIVPISWAGENFTLDGHRGTERWNIYAPFGDATVGFYIDNSDTPTQTVNVSNGSISNADVTFDDAENSIIKSNVSVLIFYDGGTQDAAALYPASTDLWGVSSNNAYLTVLYDNTQVTRYYSTSSTSGPSSISRTGITNLGGSGAQGTGEAIHIVANKPMMVVQQADADGSDGSIFLPESELETEYVLPGDAQYVAVACTQPGTLVSVYYPNGTAWYSDVNCGSNARPRPNKLHFGNSTTTTGDPPTITMRAGTRIVATHPIYVYYEFTDGVFNGGDEVNILGEKQARNYQYPEPVVEVLGGETQTNSINDIWVTDIHGYLLMQVIDNETKSVVSTVLNDTDTDTKRNIAPFDYLDIAGIWNDNPWNTTDTTNGYYNAYVALTDPYGNVLQNDSGSWINFSYTFSIEVEGPDMAGITATPQMIGYGQNMTINATITDSAGVSAAKVNIIYPNSSTTSVDMVNTGGDTWKANFSHTWQWGGYNFSVWSKDSFGDANETSSDYQFFVKANGTVDLTTQYDTYGGDELVYLSSGEVSNTGTTNISAYLVMEVRNGTGDMIAVQVNDTASQSKRNIPSSGSFGFVSAWNANPWNTSDNMTGYYSVYVVLTDPYGNMLQNDSGDNMTGYYTFYIDRDSPDWSAVGANDTTPGPQDDVEFYAYWGDNGELGGWTFEWNVTGGFEVNGSDTFAGGSSGWSNITREIPASMELHTIAYRFVANDTEGNDNTTDAMHVDVEDVTPPVVSNEDASPGFVNVNGSVSISADITDNSGTVDAGWAYIGVPGVGYENVSMSPGGGDSWSVSYMPTERGTYNATVYANDSSGNSDNGTAAYWDVYGWANVTWSGPDGGSYPKSGVVNLSCLVSDANYSTAVSGYEVTFWYDGGEIGKNHTNGTGYAVYEWNTTDVVGGGHTVNCTIGDNVTLYYNGSFVNDYTAITLLVPDVNVTGVEHENMGDYSVNEYETGDTIQWVNVTVNNTGGSIAYGVNVTLNLLGPGGSVVGWYDEQSQLCGNLEIGEICEVEFGSDSVPTGADDGGYTWNVTVNWSGGGSPPNYNASSGFYVHHVPGNMSSVLSPSKVLQNGSVVYNVTVANPWSSGMASLNVTMDCNENMTCVCLLDSVEGYCYLGTVGSGANKTASFNLTTNSSTVPGDYDINVSVNYTNPGSEDRSWSGQQNRVLGVRGPTNLNVSIEAYPAAATRNAVYDFKGYVNNAGASVTNNIWLNWTLPSGWSIQSGSMNVSNTTLCDGCILWNNITVLIPLSDSGEYEVKLNSESDEQAEDWKTETVTVNAMTNVTFVGVDDNGPFRNETVVIEAQLLYENSTAIAGGELTFYIGGSNVGSNTTDSSGYANLHATVPYDSSLGSNTVNVTYAGSGTIYTDPTYNDSVSVDVQDEIRISGVSASPQVQGYGQNVTISADVWSRVSIDTARANVSYPDGSWAWLDLAPTGGDTYAGLFGEIWDWGDYGYWIWANNSVGFGNETSSNPDNFYLRANASVMLQTESDVYVPYQQVSIETQKWWNKSWKYRKGINITEQSGDNLTDYQINVTLNTSELIQDGKLQPDCSDIRFILHEGYVTRDEYTELDHWLGDDCNQGDTEFWVNVPEIEEDSYVLIKMYYGNSGAQGKSNISGTFVFGDGFDRADNATVGNGWDEDWPAYASIVDNTLKIASGTSGTTYWKQVHHAVAAADGDYVIEFKGNVSQTDDNVFSNYFGEQSNRRTMFLFGSDGAIKYLDGAGSSDTSVSYSSDTWYDFRIWYKKSTGNANYYVDGNLEGTEANPGSSTYTNEIAFGGVSGSVSYWDDVRIRKLASAEPAVELLDEESVNSVVRNTGSTDMSFYLLMQVKNATTGQVLYTMVNDSGTQAERNASSGGIFNLSSAWVQNPWNTEDNDTGYYSVYAALTGPDGSVLVNDTGATINASYTFYMDRAPENVTLIEPENVSYTADNTTFFNWSSAGDSDGNPVTYYLQIGNDYGFGSIQLEKENLTDTDYTLSSGEALPEDVYYWRVYSYDGFTTNVSDIYRFEVNPEMAVGIVLSQNLSTGINWTVTHFPAYNLSADGNNGTGVTTYYADISAGGTTADLYVRADGDLNTTGGSTIELGNETYSCNVSNSSVPSEYKSALSTGYMLVAPDISDGETIYMKFFLTVPATQPPGTYSNIVDLRVVPNGYVP
jgi:hypothetical protein